MMAFPSMPTDAAQKADMKTPDDPDDFDPAEFLHFQVFCTLQLARPMRPGEHWENAKVIAAVPDDKITTHTLGDFLGAGLRWQS